LSFSTLCCSSQKPLWPILGMQLTIQIISYCRLEARADRIFRGALKRLLSLTTCLAILGGVANNIRRNLTYKASWSVGEWLINYAGGFDRRGLPGQVIYEISSGTGIPPWTLATLISLAAWLALSVTLLKVSRSVFSPVLIFSSFCLASPLIGGFMVRKDCFNLVLLALSVLLIRWSIRKTSSGFDFYLASGSAGVLGVVGVLSHESYGFYALPSVVAAILCLGDQIFDRRKTGSGLLLVAVPILLSTFICAYFKGTPAIAEAINLSWSGLADRIPGAYAEKPAGAIWAISMSSIEGLRYSLEPILLGFGNQFIWRPLPLLASFIVSLGVISSPAAFTEQGRPLEGAVRRLFILILLCMLPVFVAGHDYGRWLFMIFTATILTVSICGDALLSNKHFMGQKLLRAGARPMLSLSGKCWMVALLLWGIPAYWNGWSLEAFLSSSVYGFLISLGANAFGMPLKLAFPALILGAFLVSLKKKALRFGDRD
jgi:hypothetical protein